MSTTERLHFAAAGAMTPQAGRRQLLREREILDPKLTPEAIDRGVRMCLDAGLSDAEIDRVFPERGMRDKVCSNCRMSNADNNQACWYCGQRF
jgi:hypothetical protein